MGGGWTPGKGYGVPSRQEPDIAVAGGSGGLALRFYRLKTSHCLTG